MPEFHYFLPERPTARQRKERDEAFAKWAAEQRARVERQRALFAANLGPARASLQAAMLDRAWALLDAGEWEAADALLEFVPAEAATKLLDEFFRDD